MNFNKPLEHITGAPDTHEGFKATEDLIREWMRLQAQITAKTEILKGSMSGSSYEKATENLEAMSQKAHDIVDEIRLRNDTRDAISQLKRESGDRYTKTLKQGTGGDYSFAEETGLLDKLADKLN